MYDSNGQIYSTRQRASKQDEHLELSVIVPCYNEGNHIMGMAEDLAPWLDKTVGLGRWQFVMVSNGCKDNTLDIMTLMTDRWPHTLPLRLERANYGNALRLGLREAQGKWALIINVDFWDPVFLSWSWANRNNYDLIIGSKRADPWLDKRPRYRKALTWGLNVLLQIYFGLVATDTHGQKLLFLPRLRPILNECVMSRGQFDTEFTLRSQRKGLRIAELPVPIVEARKQRNLMLKKITQNVFDIFRLKNVMKKVPQSDGIRYHRYSRQDMESR